MAKTAVITGATLGIGRAIAIAHARQGANVAISGRREEAGNGAVREIEEAGGRGLFVVTDVQRTTDIERFILEAADFSPLFTSNVPLQKIGLDHEIASAMTFLSSNAASYVTGQTLTVDGGHSIKMSAANFQPA
jgi:NAD(P)-dependent dehydrogenase (short-subunit alcohol dehydrogenase family)